MGEKESVAILTGGGDCPGLNAVIRAIVTSSLQASLNIYGIRDGFGGLIEDKSSYKAHAIWKIC